MRQMPREDQGKQALLSALRRTAFGGTGKSGFSVASEEKIQPSQCGETCSLPFDCVPDLGRGNDLYNGRCSVMDSALGTECGGRLYGYLRDYVLQEQCAENHASAGDYRYFSESCDRCGNGVA